MNVLDLFSGIGGWTLGLERAGFTTVAACEADDWKRAQYERLYPNVKVYTDVRELEGGAVRRDCGKIDLVCGSPPCKHISSARAGGQLGVDGDGLFFEAVRLVRELRPLWIAFENSPHLRTRGADRVLAALEGEGYACWPIVVGACHAGAAHKRQRVWIMGRLAAGEQGRTAGQPRQSRRLATDADGDRVRIEPGRSNENEGREAPLAEDVGGRLGPVGQASLSEHLRAYDGVPSGHAERARHAYGDAVLPQITEAIGRAIRAAEAAS